MQVRKYINKQSKISLHHRGKSKHLLPFFSFWLFLAEIRAPPACFAQSTVLHNDHTSIHGLTLMPNFV